MSVLGYPKLKYPLDRRSLSFEHGIILCAYDLIYRLLDAGDFKKLEQLKHEALMQDAQANLIQLGSFINSEIGKDRFEDEWT